MATQPSYIQRLMQRQQELMRQRQQRTKSLMGEIQNIKTAAASGKPSTLLASPAAGGQQRRYTSTQLQTLKDIQAAKQAGADVRQFRTDTEMGMTREQEALQGTIGLGVGGIKLSKVGEFAAQEKKLQEKLNPIRQQRKSMLQQQVKAMRRQTGRRALLASPSGGAGFFGGYFKG